MSMSTHKAYTVLMSLELGSIAIKYQGLYTNPFQQSSPIMLLFLTCIFCHVLASTADITLPVTIITFHISGVVGCEALLWILIPQFWNWYIIPQFWNWYIINIFLLLVTSFCFFNSIGTSITKLLLPKESETATAQSTNFEPQESQP